MDWHRLSDKTRTRRANVGDIKFSIAWGPNEKTILTVQIEEGYAITKYLQSSLAIKSKARGFFSKKKEEDKGEMLPSAFLKFSIDGINKRKTKVVKVGVVHARAPAVGRAHSCKALRSPLLFCSLRQSQQRLQHTRFFGYMLPDAPGRSESDR